MNFKEISSASNVEVKSLKKIRRGSEPFFLVEGGKLIRCALSEGLDMVSLWSHRMDDLNAWPGVHRKRLVPERIYSSISPTKVSSGPLAVFESKFSKQSSYSGEPGRFLLLDGVQDPGNAGALIRAAAGFDFDGVIWHGQRPWLYHHALIRASAGTLFHIKHFSLDLREQSDKMPLMIGTVASGGALASTYAWPHSFVICLGNEGHGLSHEIESQCRQFVTIKINSKVESLNVAGAAHVLLYLASQITTRS
jgi:TrmH family RNA methyltransferase